MVFLPDGIEVGSVLTAIGGVNGNAAAGEAFTPMDVGVVAAFACASGKVFDKVAPVKPDVFFVEDFFFWELMGGPGGILKKILGHGVF